MDKVLHEIKFCANVYIDDIAVLVEIGKNIYFLSSERQNSQQMCRSVNVDRHVQFVGHIVWGMDM